MVFTPFKRIYFLILLPLLLFCSFSDTLADDGYRLWMRYDKIGDEKLRERYLQQIRQVHYAGNSTHIEKAKEEIQRGLSGLLAQKISFSDRPAGTTTLVAGTPRSSSYIRSLDL